MYSSTWNKNIIENILNILIYFIQKQFFYWKYYVIYKLQFSLNKYYR